MIHAARPFIVISGLPGSGKSTLARQLAPLLGLPLIDKDDILERLFESKGTGTSEWRRSLSRESDQLFQVEAAASKGAILVSFWHRQGMPSDSGTPTGWLTVALGRVVHLRCICAIEIAAQRFIERKRHRGHLDSQASDADILAKIRAIASLGPLEIGPLIEVDTSKAIRIRTVIREIGDALNPVHT